MSTAPGAGTVGRMQPSTVAAPRGRTAAGHG